jgi:K+/H+ antiporter YhaU regulatory subunit KhtT
MTGIISLLLIISLSLLATRIGALALVHTGLAKEAAKFQARSAFMGVGFTTNESELVVNNPVRRKILTILMFLGNAGVITTISSVIFSFISLEQSGFFSVEILVLTSGLLALFLLSQSKWIDRKLSNVINRALSRYTYLDVRDYYSLLHLSDDYRVSEIKVEEKNWLMNKSLHELDLAAEGIIVLGIKRGNGKYVGAPVGDTMIKEHDILILYGRIKLLEKLEKRKEGNSGDREHQDAVNEQEEIERNQEKE